MALCTVQRSPSPSTSPETLSSDLGDGEGDEEELDENLQTPSRSRRSLSARQRLKKVLKTVQFVTRIRFSESYLTVKGAALILPQSECARTVTRGNYSGTGDIQSHLQSMFYLLRPHDTIKVAVKLESSKPSLNRYMTVVSTQGRQDTEESVILGVDILADTATIGMVLPIWGDMEIRLDGDGGFSVSTIDRHHIFKPVSVQAMWSALQTLIKVRDIAQQNSYHKNGLTHTWTTYYEVRTQSEQTAINEWFMMDDIESHRVDATQNDQSADKANIELLIKCKLKEIMMTVDLEEVTSKFLRTKLEEQLKRDLRDYRHFIDEEMIIILRQMDSPSEIFDFLYLGSEWNASNLEELRENGIGGILNVTREIDNFFPGMFEYYNVRLWDVEQSELMKHWDDTFKFVHNAKERNSKVLVHCKMGVSRSASTVIAFAMKEYGWSLEQAYQHVKSRRSCVKPNAGFMQQLITYQGILDASNQRHNKLWRSVSTGNLEEVSAAQREAGEEESREITELLQDESGEGRPRSWSPQDSAAQLLLKAQDLGTDSEMSEEEQPETCAESLDTTYQQEAPLSPFLFTIDNWEELDISSRSADSLDDILDVPSLEQKEEDFGMGTTSSHQVVLKAFRPLSADTEDPPVTVNVTCDETGGSPMESDSEDFIVQDGGARLERGCYDICMLTGHHTLLEALSNDDDEDDESYDGINIWYLHPDTKMETIQSHFRKQRRIAQLLKLSQKKEEEEKAKIIKARKQKRKLLAEHQPLVRHNSNPLLSKKVKPDDYWIKEAEDKSDIPADGNKVEPENMDSTSMEVSSDSNNTVSQSEDVEMKKEELGELNAMGKQVEGEQIEAPPSGFESSSQSVAVPGLQTSQESPDSQSPTLTVTTEGLTVTGSGHIDGTKATSSEEKSSQGEASPETPNKESGVWEQYHKEDIPWSPGTVKRQTLDLEEKIKSTSGGVRRTSSSSDSSLSYQDALTSQQDWSNDQNIKPGSELSDNVEWESSESAKPDPLDSRQLNVAGITDSLAPENLDSASCKSLEKRVSPCIYDTEEISLEPGLVKRTKMEFEQRERSSSYAEIEGLLKDSKPVQRSSSWKIERTKSKNRESERRKTCLPVLQFSPLMSRESSVSREEAGNDASNEENTPDSAELLILKIGDEDIEVKHGQVRRRTKDFETLTVEEERLLGLLSLPTRERARSHSPYVEEGLTIPAGSVKRQTKELETKYRPDGEPCVQGEDEQGKSDGLVTTSDKPSSHMGTDDSPPTTDPMETRNTTEGNTMLQAEVTTPYEQMDIDNTVENCHAEDQTTITIEGVTTDSSSDFEKYQAIRTESLPTLLLQEQGEEVSLTDDGKVAEELQWRSGIVRLQKQAIESKAKETGQSAGADSHESPYKMTPELLTLIRRVGSALVDTPKGSIEKPTGSVKKVAQDIERRAEHKHFQGRMVILEKKVACRLDLGSPDKGGNALSRSASLKEKSRSPDKDVTSALIGRSSSLKESGSSEKKSLTEKTQLSQAQTSYAFSSSVSSDKSPNTECTAQTLISPNEHQKDFVSSTEPTHDSAKNLKTTSCASAEEECAGQAETINDDRKVVKDLMGFFEPKIEGDDVKKESPSMPRRSATVAKASSPKSPKETTKSDEAVKKRSTSETQPGLAYDSRPRTKSETSKDKHYTVSNTKALKESTSYLETNKGKEKKEPSPARPDKIQEKSLGSHETSSISKPTRATGESTVRKTEDTSKTKSESVVFKQKTQAPTQPTPVGKSVGQKSSVSSVLGKNSESQSMSLMPPPAKEAALKQTNEGRKSPKSEAASTVTKAPSSPAVAKCSTAAGSIGSKLYVSKVASGGEESTVRPELRKQTQDRKGSLPALSRGELSALTEPARPRTLSCTAGDNQSQGTPAHAALRAKPAISPATGQHFIPLSPDREPNLSAQHKARKAHGKSHPLSKLSIGPEDEPGSLQNRTGSSVLGSSKRHTIP